MAEATEGRDDVTPALNYRAVPLNIRHLLHTGERFSDDRDTQVACGIDNGTTTPVWSGNCFPQGVKPLDARRQRPAKYNYIMHAELRALMKAAKRQMWLRGATMYLNWFPCATCAGAIIEAGINTLVCDRDRYLARKDDPAYGFAAAMEMLLEAHVVVEWGQFNPVNC